MTSDIAVALIPVGSFVANIIGYVTGALLTVGLVVGFAQIDARRRMNPYYRPAQGMRVMSVVALVLGIGAAVAHAIYVAVELASR